MLLICLQGADGAGGRKRRHQKERAGAVNLKSQRHIPGLPHEGYLRGPLRIQTLSLRLDDRDKRILEKGSGAISSPYLEHAGNAQLLTNHHRLGSMSYLPDHHFLIIRISSCSSFVEPVSRC